MKKNIPLLIFGALSSIVSIFAVISVFNNSSENIGLKKKLDAEPYITISRVEIDSVDNNGKVFARELHAGDAGSAGGNEEPIVFNPTDESRYWAQSKFYIPEVDEVFVLHAEINGKKIKKLITPSW